MDHLKTSQERKDRWYARSIVPEYVPVKSVSLEQMRQTSAATNSNTTASPRNSPEQYHQEHVAGIPLSFLRSSSSNPHQHTVQQETKQFLKDHLATHGFAVIQDVLDKGECNHALGLAWDYLEVTSSAEHAFQNQDRDLWEPKRKPTPTPNQQSHQINKHEGEEPKLELDELPPVRRQDRETYRSKYFPRAVEGQIFPYYGSGHSSFMWYIRSHQNVKTIFGAIHDAENDFTSARTIPTDHTSSLVSSLDGFMLWTDMDNENKDEEDLDRGWFHIDQSPEKKPGFASFQALVNLLPVSPDVGGNVVVVGSHILFPNHYLEQDHENKGGLFYQKRIKELNGDDWLEIDPNDELLRSKRVITCLLDPGDVLIWDSRTVHCSYREKMSKVLDRSTTTTIKHTITNKSTHFDSQHGLVRAAALVNMIPRSQVTHKVSKERIRAVSKFRTLTHWVNKCAPLGEERAEEVRKESYCVEYLRENSKVLLSFDDLGDDQRAVL